MSTADDDERTVTGPPVPGRRAAAEPVTGIDAERARGRAAAAGLQGGHTLALGTRLRDYEITGLVGEGGFGIVYLAWDHSLQRRVAIKEYMPASMAARVSGSSAIVVKSERHLDTFRAGLKSFVNEARLLARFDHPSLVKVYRFWEENGTAYMAMPYYEGPTLKAALAALGRPPSEDELRAWLRPLLAALELMHGKHCYHRDIAPDNILLTPRGPLLLDFGAARRVIGDMTHAFTVVLKPGYAPIEQYGEVATMTQGAWTDLYALASVVYFAITGSTPTSSVERLMDDRVEPLAVAARGRYGDALLRAVDRALAVRPADRPQSVAEFRALLGWPATPPAAAPDSGWSSGWGSVPAPLEDARPTAPEPRADAERTAQPVRDHAPPRADVSAPPNRSARRRTVAIASAIAAVVALAVLGALQPRIIAPRGPAPAASAAAAQSTSTLASAPEPATPTTATTRDATPPASAETPAHVSPPTIVEPPARTATPDEPSRALPPPRTASPDEPAVAPPPATADGGEGERPAAAASTPRAPRPRREAAPRSEGTATPSRGAVNSRCSDILQKASLEPLSPSERETLRRECG